MTTALGRDAARNTVAHLVRDLQDEWTRTLSEQLQVLRDAYLESLDPGPEEQREREAHHLALQALAGTLSAASGDSLSPLPQPLPIDSPTFDEYARWDSPANPPAVGRHTVVIEDAHVTSNYDGGGQFNLALRADGQTESFPCVVPFKSYADNMTPAAARRLRGLFLSAGILPEVTAPERVDPIDIAQTLIGREIQIECDIELTQHGEERVIVKRFIFIPQNDAAHEGPK